MQKVGSMESQAFEEGNAEKRKGNRAPAGGTTSGRISERMLKRQLSAKY